ncbi:PREDICTED: intraflagellar transport protein 140 homolog [Bactrocera latifrons]|uniref:intraflagellar transport protein 140 homolog n=1 Tax=Bactrocera latifrons TaxID=174628 RepID=UPI0008DE811F|nr:PREDICTED: intraflagellar transport protein 140 homolog [Bactrocera latifrons]
MTLYFDTKVEFLDFDAVSTIGNWHLTEPLFAVASYSQERGGSITIFTDSGEPQRDVTYPVHPTSQVSALAWHPEKVLLATGWENGDIHVWFAGHREFASVHGPHKAPIVLLDFSEQGGRMVTADSMGLLTGWRCDGQYQFLTMFSHDLRDVLLHITFRRTIESEVREEIVNLAKAAVAGDDAALDTLTNWRPRTAARSMIHAGVKDNHCFYVGTQNGVMYYINQGGVCTEVLKNNTVPIMQMLWHPKKDAVICLMEDMTIALYLVESTGILTELDRVKLSGQVGKGGAISWAGNSLAIITGDLSVRIWDIEKSDNYLLKMDLPSTAISVLGSSISLDGNSASTNVFSNDTSEKSSSTLNSRKLHKFIQPTNELFTCLAYSTSNQTLCAGTNQGNIYTWKRRLGVFDVPEDSWQLTNISTVRGAVKQCIWGFNELAKPCMLINCISNVYVLKEQPLLSFYTRDLWAVQRNAKAIYLEHVIGKHALIQTDFAIVALALNQLNMIISNGRAISAYNIEKVQKVDDYRIESYTDDSITKGSTEKDSSLNVKLIQTFNAECLGLHIHNQNIFCLNSNEVMIYSIGGVVLNKILANDNEGKIIGMDLTGVYLSVFTMNGFIKAYDVSRHDPKIIFPGKSGYDLFDDFGEVILVKCNTAGTHLAVLIANRNFFPKPILYCWNFERNLLMEHNLIHNSNEINTNSCMPVNVFWDTDEPRLLAIEVKSMQQLQEPKQNHIKAGTNYNHSIESEIMVLFFSEKNKLNILETRLLAMAEQLINLCVPNVITLDINLVKERPLQDFVDLIKCDPNIRKMVLNFSLHIAEGNMDLAYRSIRSIQSPTIWTNLAKMCVQTSRLDVAKVCMGHLGKARSVRAIRQAMEDDDLEDEAKLAVLATELGMHEKAVELYKKCGRFDLLNKLLQARGKIDEAINVAETEDRVHLKNTYFHKAQQLKESGDIKAALEYFEKSHNPVQNITQMLLDNPLAMKRYMQSCTDPKMLKWWGQYIESSGDMDAALAVYQKAEDWFSQVKILCYLGKISKADVIARQSGDRAACYHLARHYENVGKFQEAIMFYTRAQTFSNAIRICKENDFQDELWTVASSSRSRDKAIAAAYFEECGSFKRAVELYHRAGMLHKALEMAFESEQPEVLEIIASELTVDSDSELVNRCADFFTSIEQHQKAVYLLAKTMHLKRSLQICMEKGVPITEELAEMLTPNKNEFNEEMRIEILTQLGELLQQQGDYHTATKKFTQAGDKVRAMKSLLKSGSTEKIIFFANMSRQREVYIMAANYLQALNWQEDEHILKHIVIFYSKGQAYDSLANFYAICAQIEIEEYHNYEKALKAMLEAANCLKKLGHSQHALNNLEKAIADVRKVLDIQNAMKNNDNQAVISGCRNMLIKPETPPIRQADILAMLVRALAYSKQWSEAGRALKELALKDNAWSTIGLVDKALVQKIAKECNLDFDIIWNSGRRNVNIKESETDQDNEEEIEEELR